ncbi:PAS domain-containing sensor histidine kinase [Ancylomarina sp. 16SWW S1-10-2]|uniref:sensor histidine kinase n=1 Tax=Ancylomarina sp. 16SWW S1-10-2 TaxID=2499681 RepID=UPI0012AE2787|nr:ATP-binding protein [Ancylomarina sp. 16SWW S1-10-2]MRT94490.1 sensor histidine kinase [Ancylomarina sp. 16SWW S1-10-2]
MKKYKLIISLLVVFLLSIIIGIITDYQANTDKKSQTKLDDFQEVFFEKEALLDQYLASLANSISKEKKFISDNDNLSKQEKELKDKDLLLFALDNDSLIYWSNNSIDLTPSIINGHFESEVQFIDNSWFYIKKLRVGEEQLLGLILIQKEYTYENKYLKKHFAKAFDLPDSYIIHFHKDDENAIKNTKGKSLFNLEKEKDNFLSQPDFNKAVYFYLLSLLCGVLLAIQIIRVRRKLWFRSIGIIVFGFLLVWLRYIMLSKGIPNVFSSMELFSPVLFASSFYFPSLGDFAINSFFIFSFIYTYTTYFPYQVLLRNRALSFNYIFLIINLIFFSLLYATISMLFKNLVLDSSMSFQMYEIKANWIYSMFGLVVLIQLFYGLILLGKLTNRSIKDKISTPLRLLVILLFFGVYTLLKTVMGIQIDWLGLGFELSILIALILIDEFVKASYYHTFFISLLLFISIFISNRINTFAEQKEKQARVLETLNLSSENSPTSETLLIELEKQIKSDTLLKKLCIKPVRNETKIINYLENNLLIGYWEQFHIQITVCGETDELNIEPDNQIRNCYEFFEEMILKNGELIIGSHFYNLNEYDGMVSYLGKLEIETQKKQNHCIFIRLDSKSISQGLGYPDLLLDEKIKLQPSGKDYSFGKYRNGKLIASSGEFNYYLNDADFGKSDETYAWKKLDHYSHLIFRFGENSLVLSSPEITWLKRFISIPYIFILFYIFTIIIAFIERFPWHLKLKYGFKYRIQYSIIAVLMLFFLLLGGGSVYYNIEQFNQKHNKELREKLQIIKQQIIPELQLNPTKSEITERLQQISSLIFADIHLYSIKGELIASSRHEIFDKKVQGKQMNFSAFYQLFHKGRTHFIHKEQIGSMEYLSAYESLVDADNKLLAFINLPYFIKSQDLRSELINLILTGINLHLFMILIAIFVSVIISNKITQPLRLIENKLQSTQLGKHSTAIEYTKNDEIGSLIKVYNKMLVDLEQSAELLAQSERETAWREMARQVAHEIKNPLTPMKLSIQFLLRRYDDQSPDWGKHLKQFSETLIHQIDTLSSIATAFSNFAKMPESKLEVLNLVDILKHALSLYQNDKHDIKLNLNGIDEAMASLDREQFVRIYVNLLNNAIEAIPNDKAGIIKIDLKKENGYWLTSVSDNGKGVDPNIKERLFYPNFTTKSSGMGLGLAIVKNNVTQAGGKIWVESELGKGSTFYIKIPKLKQS